MVVASPRSLRGSWRGAVVDHVAAVGIAAWPRFHEPAAGCARAVPFRKSIDTGAARHADARTHQFRACHANTGRAGQTHADCEQSSAAHTNTDGWGNTITDARSNVNANPDPNTDPNADRNASSYGNPNTGADSDSRAPGVQPRVRDRDGKRGIDQPDWE